MDVQEALRERLDALTGDLFANYLGEEGRRQPRVVGVIGDKARGCLNRECVELLRAGPVVEAPNGLDRDPIGINIGNSFRAPAYGTDDLIDIKGLQAPTSLTNGHLSGSWGGWFGVACLQGHVVPSVEFGLSEWLGWFSLLEKYRFLNRGGESRREKLLYH
jgi:hypothetical protein